MINFKRYLIYVFIISIIFFSQAKLNNNIALANEKDKTISLYDNVNLYDMENYVQTIQTDDKSSEFNVNTDTNINLAKTQSLLNISSTQEDIDSTKNYIDEHQSNLVDGYALHYDDETYYVKDIKDLRWLKNQMIKMVAPNYTVAQEMINSDGAEMSPYVEGDKTLTKIKLENNISITEGKVPENQLENSQEELLSDVVFNGNEIIYSELLEDETLQEFADRNGITYETLVANNPSLQNDELSYEGQKLIVNDMESTLSVAYYYERTVTENLEYPTETIQDDDMNIGQEEVVISGADGVQNVTYEAKEVNGELEYYNVLENEVVEKPVVEVKRVGTHELDGAGTGTFIWPSDSRKISCDFGCYSGHTGVDIQNYYGAPIMASDSGTVTYSGCSGDYGCHVIIDHQNGYETIYAHMSKVAVEERQKVGQSQVIGYEGNTGNVTGANGGIHIHFEIRYNGQVINPMTFFD